MHTLPLKVHRALAVLALLLAVTAPAARAEGPAEPRRVEDTFRSGGKDIAVERYEPVAKGSYPAILLLHAIGGLEEPHGSVYRAQARRYAGKGYVVLLVHYFDGTGSAPERVKAAGERFFRFAKGKCTADEEREVKDDFRAWIDSMADAVSYARCLPNVDGKHVGAVGFSLGAYLALASAAERDLKLSAVVEFFGGLPLSLRDRAKDLPPTLIIHGDADTVVPVSEAHELREALERANRPFELKVYEGAEHVFSESAEREKRPVSWTALRRVLDQVTDAEKRTAAFLAKYLKGEVPRVVEMAGKGER
jgi:carboxymethylenebutenolidase